MADAGYRPARDAVGAAAVLIGPGAHEAEPVLPLDLAKRRHVEHLVRRQLAAKADLRAGQQVNMAAAKGVVDLDHDGGQAVVGPVAIPEADRLEGITQHARIGLQPDLARGIGHPFALQQFIQPGQAIGAAVTVVSVVKCHPAGAVAAQRWVGLGPQAAQRQQQKPGRVVKGMRCGPQALVPHPARAQLGLGGCDH